MTLRIVLLLFILTVYSCNSDNKKLPADIKTTACFRTHSSILQTNRYLPDVKINSGDSTVFDYISSNFYGKKIINNDTVFTPDDEFFERVTFEISSQIDTFSFSSDSLQLLNGFYEFHGGEGPVANTDFRINKGFIKGHKQNGIWIIGASVGVVDKQKSDSIIQEIKFNDTFKNCN